MHFLFSRIRECCTEFFQLQLNPKFACLLRSMLAAKMFVIQTRNYILKWVNYRTYLQVRCVGNWTYIGWLEVSRNFRKFQVREISSHPRCVQSRTHLRAYSMFVIEASLKRGSVGGEHILEIENNPTACSYISMQMC